MEQQTSKAKKRPSSQLARPRLTIRRAVKADASAIAALSRRIYKSQPALNEQMVRGQMNNFPEGQFVAEYNGEVVGYCATFIIGEAAALSPHSWHEITGNGFASRHDPEGEWLYGMDISVDPDRRRLRIGQRLYNARKMLAQELGLKGIVFGGRMPGLARRAKDFKSPIDYLTEVREMRMRDQVVNFHLSQGFEPIGVLEDYEPGDRESMGYASHMVWRNPTYQEAARRSPTALTRPDTVRVVTVQYQMRGLANRDEFAHQVGYFVDVASDYRADFVVFPELITLQLLSLETEPLPSHEAARHITQYTDWFIAFMRDLAVSFNINIIGGSHPTLQGNGDVRNAAYVFLRDGAVHRQDKIHPTPSEIALWNIKGGSRVDVIETDCGPIGVLICYDSQFPELARYIADQGASLLFVPFCTDDRRGFMRVRYCSHARAVENQMYVITSGVVGNLPKVDNMNVHYAESAVITPCDIPFARDGVAADTAPNTEMVAVADLRLSDLRAARRQGHVRNYLDRRFDLYRVVWRGGDPNAEKSG